jgi:NTE family protein
MPNSVGLVLAGGGARGAYEVGALSALLPWLEREYKQRPDVIVGTSVGALNAAYLAANAHHDAETLTEEAMRKWLGIGYRQVLDPVFSLGELASAARLTVSILLRRVLPYSLLDPAPLEATLGDLITFGDIRTNREKELLSACAVVATAAHTNRSVVFHDGGPNPPSDDQRGIDYVPTAIREEHVRASAAIPVLFPAVEVEERGGRGAWYFDGGTRLNTPIKPALKLGAERVIVIGLNSLAAAPASTGRADLFDGASQLVQGLLVDPLVNDLETLVAINETLMASGLTVSPDGKRRLVPYIFVAPQSPNRIGEIAGEVYAKCYTGLGGLRRSRDLYLLGHLLGADRNSTRGELFSYLFFANEFAKRLLELGQEDAQHWIAQAHDDGAWQHGPRGQSLNDRHRARDSSV